ncbi:MAG: CBS domain-containing protein [bacterium]|nr:CBS domain-containing protein [bacterium]
MEQKLLVRDIMTVQAVTVKPEDSVVYVAKLLYEHNFSGIPVVNERGQSVGLVTEYDLIAKGDTLHLPTLINILGNIDTYKKDSSLVRDDLKRMMILKIKDVMNTEPLTIEEGAPIVQLAELFAHHHRVNPILVVDRINQLVGVVSRFDLVKFFVDKDVDRVVGSDSPDILDKRVDNFIDNFEKKFAYTSKAVEAWWMLSLAFGIVGLVVIFALIMRGVGQ